MGLDPHLIRITHSLIGHTYRFLCPPPTAIMIGNSWWNETAPGREDRKPPRVTVSISGESVPPECAVEWSSTAGKQVDPSDPPSADVTYLGRAVGKQLFISDERQKKVEALVKIVAPSSEDEPERIIGTFPSRPIKVISKPSKKRQSAKNMERKSCSPSSFTWVCGSSGASLSLPAPSCPPAIGHPKSHRRLSKPSSVCWRSVNLTQIQCASIMDQRFHSSIDYDRKPFRRNICACLAQVPPSRDRMDNLCPGLIRARVVVHLLSWRARVPGVSRFLFLMLRCADLTSFLDSLCHQLIGESEIMLGLNNPPDDQIRSSSTSSTFRNH
jgi:hypothetical protein